MTEESYETGPDDPAGAEPAADDEVWAFDADGYLRDLSGARRKSYGSPPRPGRPLPVLDVPVVLGRRVVLMTAEGPIYDHRAVSEVYQDDSGTWINVATEEAWYAWRAADPETRPALGPPGARAWAAVNVYAEVYAG